MKGTTKSEMELDIEAKEKEIKNHLLASKIITVCMGLWVILASLAAVYTSVNSKVIIGVTIPYLFLCGRGIYLNLTRMDEKKRTIEVIRSRLDLLDYQHIFKVDR